MLTEQERLWLENRDNFSWHYCRWCGLFGDCYGEWEAPFCPAYVNKTILLDALEFDERVIVKLAKAPSRVPPPDGTDFSKFSKDIDKYIQLRLRFAQELVEFEMDGEAFAKDFKVPSKQEEMDADCK